MTKAKTTKAKGAAAADPLFGAEGREKGPGREVVMVSIEELIPYARNARTHDDAQVAQIAASLREFGWVNPVLVDGNRGIIAGHGRVLAARKLGMTEVPCLAIEHLTEAQKKAYMLADNKIALNAGWDEALLKLELEELKGAGFDLGPIGFSGDELAALFSEGEKDKPGEGDDYYTGKIEPPIYEPTGERPAIADLYDNRKAEELAAAIDKAKVPEEVKAFLRIGATRHISFNFQRIAEFYCHAEPDVQRLMEDSAMVIIDFKKAIEGGFVRLSEGLMKQAGEDWEGASDDEGE